VHWIHETHNNRLQRTVRCAARRWTGTLGRPTKAAFKHARNTTIAGCMRSVQPCEALRQGKCFRAVCVSAPAQRMVTPRVGSTGGRVPLQSTARGKLLAVGVSCGLPM